MGKVALNVTTTYYAGSFVYEGSSLKYILHGEGMITMEGTPQYQYHIRDLPKAFGIGNNRLTVNSGGTIVDQAAYYPFGMLMTDKYNGGINNKYLYNGKELQDDELAGVNLDWYDYGARFYDASLARFHTLDPKTEDYLFQSPFVYAANNPVIFIDDNGEGPILGIVGAIGGALVEAGSQVVGNMATGKSISEAIRKIDYADVAIAAVEYGLAGLTNGASLAAGSIVADAAKASIDVSSEGEVKTVFNGTKSAVSASIELGVGKVAGDALGKVSKKLTTNIESTTKQIIENVSEKMDDVFEDNVSSLSSKTMAKDTKLDIQGGESIVEKGAGQVVNSANTAQAVELTKKIEDER